MKRKLHKFIASAIMLIALQITLTAQPVGSQIKTDTSGHISYWNGVDAWIPVAPGLPGQTLKFTEGVPSWVNNPNGIITTAVSNVTGTTAVSGGNILSDGGAKITARGVCWSTSPNPTIADNKTIDGSGIGSFTSNLTDLNDGLTYYIRSYATNINGTRYGNEISFLTPFPVYDFDGNGYDTVHIGTQVWMKQNLKTTKYRNGTTIPIVIDNPTWMGLNTGARCYYNNDSATFANNYGALYNWYAVNTGNLCPIGWHVPTYDEWTTLTNYLGGGSIAGGKLKATSFWNSPNTGATNSSGFSAYPGGKHDYSSYYDNNNIGYWWSSTIFDNTHAYARKLYYNYSVFGNDFSNYYLGYSVRCSKGILAIITTSSILNLTQTTAVCGGTINNDGGFPVTERGICWSTSPNPTIADNKTIDGSGIGSFTSNLNGLISGTTYYVRAYAKNAAGIAYGNEISFSDQQIFAIGQSYQGGIIAYILQSGDNGYVAGETHGIIAAPNDQSIGIKWFNGVYTQTGSNGTSIGTGNSNTNAIVASQGDGNYAAKICYDLVLNGYTDWYLPSVYELNKLYINSSIIGGFSGNYYWSSTEYSNILLAFRFDFFYGGAISDSKSELGYVRAIRSF